MSSLSNPPAGGCRASRRTGRRPPYRLCVEVLDARVLFNAASLSSAAPYTPTDSSISQTHTSWQTPTDQSTLPADTGTYPEVYSGQDTVTATTTPGNALAAISPSPTVPGPGGTDALPAAQSGDGGPGPSQPANVNDGAPGKFALINLPQLPALNVPAPIPAGHVAAAPADGRAIPPAFLPTPAVVSPGDTPPAAIPATAELLGETPALSVALATPRTPAGPADFIAAGGSDPLLLLDLNPTGTAGDLLPSPGLESSEPALGAAPVAETVAPPGAPLTVTVELAAPTLPTGKTSPDRPASQTPAAPVSGNPMPTPLGERPSIPADSGDTGIDPDIQEQLRQLKLDRRGKEGNGPVLSTPRPVPDLGAREAQPQTSTLPLHAWSWEPTLLTALVTRGLSTGVDEDEPSDRDGDGRRRIAGP